MKTKVVKVGILFFSLIFFSIAKAQECQILFKEQKPALSAIEDLRSGSLLPDIFLNFYSTPEVATKIVQRIGSKLSVSKKNRISYPLNTESEIMMFFRPELSTRKANHGFLNFFQTGVSGAFASREMRIAAEKRLSDFEFQDSALQTHPINELRFKYSFLNLTAPIDVGPHISDARIYGQSKTNGPSAAVVFKDEVKQRTTWTDADSLLITVDPNHFGTFHENSLPARTLIPDSYFEAQTLGGLTVKDASHILFFDSPMMWAIENQQSFEHLKSLGLPIYKGITDFKFSRFIYRRGELLWKP